MISPTRPEYDRLTKSRRYAARGVPHYWIVDPDARSLECFRLDGVVYRLDGSGDGLESLTVAAFPGLAIPLADLWLDQ